MSTMRPQLTPRHASATHAEPALSQTAETPASESADTFSVAPIHLQPLILQQSNQAIALQRASWAKAPSSDVSGYLLINGQKVAVPFPTVCYDQQKNIAINSPLPTRAWAKNILSTVWSGMQNLVSISALRAVNFSQLVEPARLHSLWTQGNFQICAVPRQDLTGASIDAVVLHWDGCNSSAQMFDVLRSLGLSAHLLVDSDATVYQLMDLAEMKAYHAGWINERSIGIEFNNPVDPSSVNADSPSRQFVRELVPHQDGLVSTRLDFTSAQKLRCVQILDVLHENFNIPRKLPPTISEDGIESSPGLVAANFTGVCGHYHVGTHKIDPGLSFWPLIRRHWASLKTAPA